MYKDFFGLTRNPFDLSPDPSFMYPSGKSEEVLALIYYAISQRKGFAVLTGEVGTGKTLMVRHLCDLWKEGRIPFANVIGPRLSVTDFLSYVTFDLGIKVPTPTKGNLLRALYEFLLAQHEKGLTTVLVVDEAHQLPSTVLEEIRLLTNFETAQEKLLQVLLVGQPELDQRLDSFELRQLKQRIAIRCQLEPLWEEETRPYIERRLSLAGANSRANTIFPAATAGAIYRYSGGIPRLVNSICEQALVAAYARQIPVVPVEIIDEVASYFRLQPAPDLGRTRKLLALAEHRVNSAPELPGQPKPATNPPGEKTFDSSVFSSHATAPAAPLAHATLPREPETSLISIGPREQKDGQPSATTTAVANVATIKTGTRSPATAVPNSGANLTSAACFSRALSPYRGMARSRAGSSSESTTSGAIKRGRPVERIQDPSPPALPCSPSWWWSIVLFRSGPSGKLPGRLLANYQHHLWRFTSAKVPLLKQSYRLGSQIRRAT